MSGKVPLSGNASHLLTFPLYSVSARVTLNLSGNRLSREQLNDQFSNAWIALRAEQPILGIQLHQSPSYAFRYIQSHTEAKKWARDTLEWYHCPAPLTHQKVSAMRDANSDQHLPVGKGNQAQLWVILPEGQEFAQEVVLNLRVNHTLIDGISMATLLDNYLQLLRKHVQPQSISWTSEAFKQEQKNALPSYLDNSIMSIEGRPVKQDLYEQVMRFAPVNISQILIEEITAESSFAYLALLLCSQA